MKKKGIFLILLSLVTTFLLFLFSKPDISVLIIKPFLTIAQISALWGMIFFCYSFFLASRFSFLEIIFGGLDKVYKAHQIMGRLAFIMIIFHFIFLILNYLNNSAMLVTLIIPSKSISYNFGIISLWSMTFILTAILYLKIDYHWFVRVQKFFIVPFVLGCIHMFLIPSDVSRYLPLTSFLVFHVAIAFFSWVYKLYLYPIIGPNYSYVIDAIRTFDNDIIEVSLIPAGKEMKFLPGQFAYARFDSIGVRQEFHPFSIASSPNSNSIRFGIKAIGDFTTQLKTLKIGEKAILTGPYGNFSERFLNNREAVCIAGGIGITPFLSMINYSLNNEISKNKKIHLFYSVKNNMDAVYQNELAQMAAIDSNFSFYCVQTEIEGRLNIETVKNKVGELGNKLFFLCGPPVMRKTFANQLKTLKISTKNIIFEDFNYR